MLRSWAKEGGKEKLFFPSLTNLIETRKPNLRDAVHATSGGRAARPQFKPLGESPEKLVPTSPEGFYIQRPSHGVLVRYSNMGHRWPISFGAAKDKRGD